MRLQHDVLLTLSPRLDVAKALEVLAAEDEFTQSLAGSCRTQRMPAHRQVARLGQVGHGMLSTVWVVECLTQGSHKAGLLLCAGPVACGFGASRLLCSGAHLAVAVAVTVATGALHNSSRLGGVVH
jgi:hypothetical protein